MFRLQKFWLYFIVFIIIVSIILAVSRMPDTETKENFDETNKRKCKILPVICPAGSYCPTEGMIAPIICPIGSSCPTDGLTAHMLAKVGTFSDKQGMENANPAARGFFCPTEGMITQTPCPVGTICDTTGLAVATPCPQGFFCPNTMTRTPCPPGTFCPIGITAPIPCKAGTFCPTPTGIPITCPEGHYCPTEGLVRPFECPSGTRCTTTGLITPLECPAGSFCPPNTDDVIKSPAGFFCPETAPGDKCAVPDFKSVTQVFTRPSYTTGQVTDTFKLSLPGNVTEVTIKGEVRRIAPAVSILFVGEHPQSVLLSVNINGEVPVSSITINTSSFPPMPPNSPTGSVSTLAVPFSGKITIPDYLRVTGNTTMFLTGRNYTLVIEKLEISVSTNVQVDSNTLVCTDVANKIVDYYNTSAQWKGVYTMRPIKFNRVDNTTCDVHYDYMKEGIAGGQDRRRFTLANINSVWNVTQMGPTQSGITAVVSPVFPDYNNNIVDYYNTQGEWKGVYTMNPIKYNCVDKETCDVDYEFLKGGIAEEKQKVRFSLVNTNGKWDVRKIIWL